MGVYHTRANPLIPWRYESYYGPSALKCQREMRQSESEQWRIRTSEVLVTDVSMVSIVSDVSMVSVNYGVSISQPASER